MALVFPAILIGGPPHSGKSTLTYRLRQALLARGVAHYVLRASPDGEGNWTSEAPRSLIAALRQRTKGLWGEPLAALIGRDIANRHLPLLVDAGGKVSAENAMIAAQCTHAILIAANPDDLAPWRDLVATHGLALVADLHSALGAQQSVLESAPTFHGVIGGLAPDQVSDGPLFEALCDRVAQLFDYTPEELYRAHLALTELDLVLHVEQAIYPLAAHAPNSWRPDELPQLIGSLPRAAPLGVYGIGPGWLYAALSAFSHPARFALFDPRLGWVEPPALTLAQTPDQTRLRWEVQTPAQHYVQVSFDIVGTYLNYDDAAGLPIPMIPAQRGVIVDGRLPHWLGAALSRAYHDASWIAFYYPPLDQSVVISSRDPDVPLGSLRPRAAS